MNKQLRRYAQMPVVGPLVNLVVKLMINREGTRIAKHFAEYLQPIVACKQTTVPEVYRIRHEVYCEELGFEPERADRQEKDEFDEYSRYCLMQHISTGDYAGTVRVVSPQQEDQLLPIEKYCSFALETSELKPSDYPRHEVCEISRLAVPAQFRRRNTDRYQGAETGVINENTYSQEELRCFPFLAMGLYLAAASLAIHTNHKHAFVMMEPRLARSMAFIGVKFLQLGPAVDYHGLRAPYYINAHMLHKALPAGFKKLYKVIDQSFMHQVAMARKEALEESLHMPEVQRQLFKPITPLKSSLLKIKV